MLRNKFIYMNSPNLLVQYLEDKGVLKSAKIKNTLLTVDRKNFVPEQLRDFVYEDSALPLAEGQTISQPTTVVIMLELLDAQKGQKVLDIGAGSGWVSCLLGKLVGEQGKVFAYEINETVGKMGLENVKKFGAPNVHYEIADAADKWKEKEPFDRIHSGAAFEKIPDDLKKVLKIGGILVAPTKDGYVRKIVRTSEDEFNEEKHYGFAFVPFISCSM